MNTKIAISLRTITCVSVDWMSILLEANYFDYDIDLTIQTYE